VTSFLLAAAACTYSPSFCGFFGVSTVNTLASVKKTSGQSNLTKGRIAAADGQFSRIRQVAPVCPAMWAYWRHLANTIKLCFLRPTAVHNPNSNSMVQPSLHSVRQKVPTLYKHSCVLSNAGLCNALTTPEFAHL